MSPLLVFTIILTSFGCKSAGDYLNEANNLSEKGKYQEAILLLDKAIEKDSKYVGAYINRGADKSALGDYTGAIHDYQKALSIDPDNTLALFNTGNDYKRQEDYRTSIKYYNKAFDSKGGPVLYFDARPNDFVDLTEFDVEGCAIHFERGISYFYIDSLQHAFNDLHASISQNYMIGDCHYWIGFVYLKTGQPDLACESFLKSKQLGNKDAEQELKRYCGK
ncbi:hypothetical protein CCY01nite_08260 [Chitinophaga cymbidii]|uniref:Uncharacterized protein n=1 Tax=Chitinophaga cymbidii TaxID=1096750 RepID=A0A512RFS7_9BACT|nr:hypothetical protein CCY01nite_08260 [Chitinophaga cymbidii]